MLLTFYADVDFEIGFEPLHCVLYFRIFRAGFQLTIFSVLIN